MLSTTERMNKALGDLRIRGAAVVLKHPALPGPIVRAYGKTAASDDSPDVTTDTAFHLASVSKVFAGAAVGTLVDQKIIGLDDNICNVLPASLATSTACQSPNYPEFPVTWRMLATHRSSLVGGIPDVQDENGDYVSASYGPTGGYRDDAPAAGNPKCPLNDTQGFYRDAMVDKESETLVGRDGLLVAGGQPLNWFDVFDAEGGAWNGTYAPGEQSAYSNFGIGYLAALVEYTTGKSFEEHSQENIFSKLGMNHTSWFREYLPAETVQAIPVTALESGGYEDIAHYCYIDYASGQLHTTANDMQTWSESMLKKGAPDLWSQVTANQHVFGCQEKDETATLLDDETCSFSLTWELLNNGTRDYDELDGFLTPFEDLDWTDGVMHAGFEAGAQTQVVVLPSAGVYSVVLTNTEGNGDQAAQKLTKKMWEAAMDTLVVSKGTELDVSRGTDESEDGEATQVFESSAAKDMLLNSGGRGFLVGVTVVGSSLIGVLAASFL